ncbi:MAG: DUF3369 domain-containing protein [Magnetococcales bacterium]|nr:DUF3369 domain-containing protein [Magnetococcales bacterium]MBF0323034.1 DUF3369 domain-containing protein [Magnetococcales bacterium]
MGAEVDHDADQFEFVDEEGGGQSAWMGGGGVALPARGRPWKVVSVDDEEHVNTLTEFVLRGFVFENRELEIIIGHSGQEARRLLAEHPDTAVLLMDVVMESDSAGLDTVRYIRDTLKNSFVRIILRTGQPGLAPEPDVIANYDINDYKDKVTLSRQGLVTSITAALRAYRDLRTLESTRRGLKRIIDATGDLFEPQSLRCLASGILTQLSALVGLGGPHGVGQISSFAFSKKRGNHVIFAGSGRYEDAAGQNMASILPDKVLKRIEVGIQTKKSMFFDDAYLGCFHSKVGQDSFVYVENGRPFVEMERDLLEVFSTNASLAIDNVFLNRELLNTQKDVTFTLGEVIEVRSHEAGQHVRRVAEISRLLGTKCGLAESQVDMLAMASPLHDLGKIAIPDAILNKPGRYDEQERLIMEQHTEIGYRLLKGSNRSILQAGSIIAHEHHERWDGTGYPRKLLAGEIHVFGRITAIADVFDALSHKRCYKEAWPLEQILELLALERGRQFDPDLIDVFMKNSQEAVEIQGAFTDSNP